MALGPFGLVPLLVGKPVPLHETPAGAAPVKVQPAMVRLAGLIGMWSACRPASASGMLLVGSPPNETVAGLVMPPYEFPTSYCCPSYAPKKKSLSLIMGPPTEPPYCSKVRGVFGLGTMLK